MIKLCLIVYMIVSVRNDDSNNTLKFLDEEFIPNLKSFPNLDHIENNNKLPITNLTPALQESCLEVGACGGAWTRACANVAYNQGDVYTLKVSINSHAHCATEAPANWEDYFLYGQTVSNREIYGIDDTGCGGGNWDIGGWVYIDGGVCSSGWCSYTIRVVAKHGGVGSQCKEVRENKMLFQFPIQH